MINTDLPSIKFQSFIIVTIFCYMKSSSSRHLLPSPICLRIPRRKTKHTKNNLRKTITMMCQWFKRSCSGSSSSSRKRVSWKLYHCIIAHCLNMWAPFAIHGIFYLLYLSTTVVIKMFLSLLYRFVSIFFSLSPQLTHSQYVMVTWTNDF